MTCTFVAKRSIMEKSLHRIWLVNGGSACWMAFSHLRTHNFTLSVYRNFCICHRAVVGVLWWKSERRKFHSQNCFQIILCVRSRDHTFGRITFSAVKMSISRSRMSTAVNPPSSSVDELKFLLVIVRLKCFACFLLRSEIKLIFFLLLLLLLSSSQFISLMAYYPVSFTFVALLYYFIRVSLYLFCCEIFWCAYYLFLRPL